MRAVLANMRVADSDEYTALQKYISTYRDPKDVAAAQGASSEAKKGKKSWQVSKPVSALPSTN